MNMSATTTILRDDVNLARIFEKLGHQLEEIRVRALTNILSKLDHKLVSLHDLVQEKHFLIRLLEWSNFPNAPNQTEVFDLMCRLSQHSAAAEILRDVGGVDFLSHLRMDTTAALKVKIDEILDNLMKLPDFDDHENNGADYIFYQQPNLHFGTFSNDESQGGGDNAQHVSGNSAQLNIPAASKMHKHPSNASYNWPHPAHDRSSNLSTSFNKFSVLSSGFKTTTFPWLTLTQTDRQVLSSTNSLLQSKDPHMLISACEFLQDVVFHDFPAEVFLQRPNIVQSLFQLLDLSCNPPSTPSDPNNQLEPNLMLESCKTLIHLLGCLTARLKYHQDPTFHTPKQDFTSSAPSPTSHNGSAGSGSLHSTDTRFSALGKSDSRCRGDGRDGDSSSTSRSSFQSAGDVPPFAPEDLEPETGHSPQQLMLPQFCVELMSSGLTLLESSQDLGHVFVILQLLHSDLKLLVEAISFGVWNDHNSASRHIVLCLTKCLESISNLMQHHHHSNKTTGSKDQDVAEHRQIFLGLASFLGCFLKQLVPVDKIKLPVPDSLSSALELVVFDECLSQMWPDLHSTMLGYLHKVANERYLVYTQTARVCTSLQRTCYFLSKSKTTDGSIEELLNLAEEALLSVPYHMYTEFICSYIDFCSQFCASLAISETSCNSKQAREILCHLLSHPNSKIKEISYEHCLKVIKESLNINEAAANPSSSLPLNTKFVIHPLVLLEIVSFGMADTHKKISQSSSDIMLYLLQGQLLLEGEMWKDFILCLSNVLPVLQSYADIESPLGYCILGLIEPEKNPNPTQLPLHERMRGVLRLLFSNDVKIRSEALKRLAWFLCHEDEHQNKLPSIQELDVKDLSNLFVVSTQVTLQLDNQDCVFNSDDVEKIYHIFSSGTLDEQVKKSAIEQLVLMLLDENLHPIFQQLGGTENILGHIQRYVLKPQNLENGADDNCRSFLPSCISILSLLLQHNNALRHKLAQQQDIYYSLIRVALLHHKEDPLKTELAKIFSFLLFDEVILSSVSYKKSSEKKHSALFSLPTAVCKRYHLPFKCPLHHEASPNLNPSFICNNLTSSSCNDMMRFAWNFAWHQGINGLLEYVKHSSSKTSKDKPEFPLHLHLTSIDSVLLQKSHILTGLQLSIDGISNATNHQAVSLALNQILIYLVSSSEGNQKDVCNTLHGLQWTNTLCRFLQVVPSSPPDEWLLYQVLHFISSILQFSVSLPDHILQWFAELLYNSKGTLFCLLSRTETNQDLPEYATAIKRSLEKEVIRVIIHYISHLPYRLQGILKVQQLRGDLILRLLVHLNVAEAPHFYNLAPLEATLLCLLHITARPGWSLECTETESSDLCFKLLQCLLEVVSAFHIGRGGTVMSYMGRGVTKSATLCLRHLAFEMAAYSKNKEWPEHWLYMKQGTEALVETGLSWMLTLWAYRDPEVRCAGLGIAVALSSCKVGQSMVMANCQHIPGGIWAVAFSMLLDSMESSLVRQQAAYLLVNLTSQEYFNCDTSANQQSVIEDSQQQASLVGLPALAALLQQCEFYESLAQLLSMYYSNPTLHPLTVTEALNPCLSVSGQENTQTTSIADTSNSTHHSPRGQFLRGNGVGQADQSQTTQTTINSHSTSSSTDNTPRSATNQAMSDSHSTTSPPAYPSVVTPSLITATCHLLHNLVVLSPEETLDNLKKHSILYSLICLLDIDFLNELCDPTESSELSCPSSVELTAQELLAMHGGLVKLVQVCCLISPTVREDVLNSQQTLNTMVQLLHISPQGSEPRKLVCESLHQQIFHLFTTLLQLESQKTLESLVPLLENHWTNVFDCIANILGGPEKSSEGLIESCLVFLAHIFAETGKMEAKPTNENLSPGYHLVTLLESQSPILPTNSNERKQKNEQGDACGSVLCEILLKIYDAAALKKADESSIGQKQLTTNSLKCLLAVSPSAKETALKAGLVESVVQQMKDLHAKLNLEFMQLGKQATFKKQSEPFIQELTCNCDLLRNFAYQDENVKLALYGGYLAQLCHVLWHWGLTDKTLLFSLIHLLTTYTAHFPKASTSMAYTHPVAPGVNSALPGRSQLSNNSLVHALVKLVAARNNRDNFVLVKQVFDLLSTLTVSGECRNILWKVNFLQEFSNLNQKKLNKKKHLRNRESAFELLWIELLTCLSFSMEGQQMILKVKDSVDLILEFSSCNNSVAHQEKALLVLRNLCCHSSNKNKLLAYNKLIPILLLCLASESETLKMVAASSLWALVFNNQKVNTVDIELKFSIKKNSDCNYGNYRIFERKKKKKDLSPES